MRKMTADERYMGRDSVNQSRHETHKNKHLIARSRAKCRAARVDEISQLRLKDQRDTIIALTTVEDHATAVKAYEQSQLNDAMQELDLIENWDYPSYDDTAAIATTTPNNYKRSA